MGRNRTASAGWWTGLLASAAACIAQPATTGLIAVDAGHDRIIEFTVWPNATSVLWEGPPLNQPTGMGGMVTANHGFEFLVCNAGDGGIIAFDGLFQSHRTFVEPGATSMVRPTDLGYIWQMRDVLYVLDAHDGSVYRFDVETGRLIDVIVAPLAPASSMTLSWTTRPEFMQFVVIAYPTLGKVIRYDAMSGALVNTVANVEGPAWLESARYPFVTVLEDFADPRETDVLRRFTLEGLEIGDPVPVSAGTAPNDLLIDRFIRDSYLLYDDRLVNFSKGTSISAPAGSRLDSLLVYKDCYVDCDPGGAFNYLDIFDFLCWMDKFVRGEAYACDCDTSTGAGVCDIFDFLCYQSAFVMGCP